MTRLLYSTGLYLLRVYGVSIKQILPPTTPYPSMLAFPPPFNCRFPGRAKERELNTCASRLAKVRLAYQLCVRVCVLIGRVLVKRKIGGVRGQDDVLLSAFHSVAYG